MQFQMKTITIDVAEVTISKVLQPSSNYPVLFDKQLL